MTAVYAYVAAHDRTRRLRGRASSHLCPCGATAQEWAYSHKDPNAQVDQFGRVYSNDPRYYNAMCRPCHRQFDTLLRITHCPRGHPYEGDNLIVWNGKRKCRECGRRRMREQYHRKRLAAQQGGLAA